MTVEFNVTYEELKAVKEALCKYYIGCLACYRVTKNCGKEVDTEYLEEYPEEFEEVLDEAYDEIERQKNISSFMTKNFDPKFSFEHDHIIPIHEKMCDMAQEALDEYNS